MCIYTDTMAREQAPTSLSKLIGSASVYRELGLEGEIAGGDDFKSKFASAIKGDGYLRCAMTSGIASKRKTEMLDKYRQKLEKRKTGK